ncbi:MAG: hypothetical protein AAGK32_01245 [Actinomycetota bacterium]
MIPWPVWLLRVLWVLLPVVAAPALSEALDARSTAVGIVLEVFAWAGWAIGLVAVLVLRGVSLTAIRVVSRLAVAGLVWAAVTEETGFEHVAAVAYAAVCVVVAQAPTLGAAFVDGSSYGPERRLPLRPPAAVALGPAQLATAVIGAGVLTGPLLLAAGQWIAGAVALVVGPPAAAVAFRALHGLNRRWLVLVPGGVVVHDPLTLTDPVLLPKEALVAIEAATTDTDAVDLTQRAPGLAVEIRLTDPGQFALARPGDEGEIVTAGAVLVTPTLPATTIEAVRDRF